MLVAILNRCLAPASKAALARWFDSTALHRLLPIRSRQLSSQRIRDHMHRVSPDAIAAIERDLVRHMTREFGLDLHQVLFDATNFFTYIGSFNQRGHDKEDRKSLRMVGAALLVTADSRLPLLHRTYPGNRPDAPLFQSLAADLARGCRELADGAEQVTLVFDKGNNSRENLDWVQRAPFHFIGSLVPTHHPDLLAVQDAQRKTLLREIDRRRAHLRALQRQLRRWRDGKIRGGRKPGLAGAQKKVDGWLRARHMDELFKVKVREKDGLPKVKYRFRRRAWEQLQCTLLGKTLIFSDNADWSDAELVRSYRAQHHVESAFRPMQDTDCIAIRPQCHWTDQKIQVHVFCWVLALTLGGLLQRELSREGIRRSVPALLAELSGIYEVDVLYPPREAGADPELRTTLSQMSAEQRSLYDTLDLEKYLS